MAQVTELKANAVMGPLLDRDFSGKTEYVPPTELIDLDEDSENLDLVAH